MQLRLKQITYLTQEIKKFVFESVDGSLLPSATPGSHVTLSLSKTLKRSYSLLNSGNNLCYYEIAVKREATGRGGSLWVHDNLPVGTVLNVSQPLNYFELHQEAEHHVLIGGGIGITPIYAMWRKLKQAKACYSLFYACRSREDGIMLDEFAQDPNCCLHFDVESGIFAMQKAISAATDKAHFYCCGPAPMLNAYHQATAHLTPSQVHFEQFSPTEAVQSNQILTVDSYEVFLAKSQQNFVMQKDQSILDHLLDAGHDLNYSCQQGICGQCETEVLEGLPCHADQILTDTERQSNKTMMICCSSSLSPRLVLNL